MESSTVWRLLPMSKQACALPVAYTRPSKLRPKLNVTCMSFLVHSTVTEVGRSGEKGGGGDG